MNEAEPLQWEWHKDDGTIGGGSWFATGITGDYEVSQTRSRRGGLVFTCWFDKRNNWIDTETADDAKTHAERLHQEAFTAFIKKWGKKPSTKLEWEQVQPYGDYIAKSIYCTFRIWHRKSTFNIICKANDTYADTLKDIIDLSHIAFDVFEDAENYAERLHQQILTKLTQKTPLQH